MQLAIAHGGSFAGKIEELFTLRAAELLNHEWRRFELAFERDVGAANQRLVVVENFVFAWQTTLGPRRTSFSQFPTNRDLGLCK
jgi:hypothetical protein